MDIILEHAKYDLTLYFRETVAGILGEWERPSGERTALSLFLEFNFPFVNLRVQKLLKERNPHSESATQFLKEIPHYPIDAYLLAEAIGWITCGEKEFQSSLFPLMELSEFFFLHDLKWFSKLLIAVAEAIEKQIRKHPNASMPKLLQDWCLNKPSSPSKWLERTAEGEAKLEKLEEEYKKGKFVDPRRIPIDAAQENKRRRSIFKEWASCWKAELRHLDIEIKLRAL
jgi:hypothetical protein